MKTIQSAVAQRLLPLRCVICRARISRLTSSSGTWRLQESASSYSVGCKSWSVSWRDGSLLKWPLWFESLRNRFLALRALTVLVLTHTRWEKRSLSRRASIRWARGRLVLQVCHFPFWKRKKIERKISGYSSGSATSRASNVSSLSSNAVDNKHHHNHNCSTNGCLGAIPRNPSYSSTHFRGHRSHSFRVSSHCLWQTYKGTNKSFISQNRIPDLPNRLPPIKEYTARSPKKSPSRHRTPSPVNSGVRFK